MKKIIRKYISKVQKIESILTDSRHLNQNLISLISASWYFSRKGWVNSWSALLRSYGAFLIRHSTKSLASHEISLENDISCLSTCINKIPYTEDLLHGFLPTDIIEGYFPSQQLIGQHPQTPQIHTPVILLPLEYLRSHVIKSPTIRLPPIRTSRRPAKITQFRHPLN